MRLLIIAAGLALSACASAVYDSLDRRGVDSATILAERASDLRTDIVAAQAALAKAGSALSAIDGKGGAPLARALDQARAAGQEAALGVQDVRLSYDSMKAASARYFADQERDLGLMKTSAENYRAAEKKLSAVKDAYRVAASALDGASLRLSPALSLYDAEITALRKAPTSAVAAEARAPSRTAAIAATSDAAASLEAAADAADRFLAALK